MNITLEIEPQNFTLEGIAVTHLKQNNNGKLLGQLDIQFSKLAALKNENPSALDFLLLAATVYALDKLVSRTSSADYWTREYFVTLPVSDPGLWTSAHAYLTQCLSFLTGDSWTFEFVPISTPLVKPLSRKQRKGIIEPQGDIVSLFSGGLDSLVGVIDHIESHRDQKILFVGHHDAKMPGPFADQRSILGQLQPLYPNHINSLLVRVGHLGTAEEITLRSRSLLFIALGIYAASALRSGTQLLIPENGTIALNVPLTPSRRGSCSTRTAHPYYLNTLQHVLSAVNLHHPLKNPLEFKTKGEAVAQCLNQANLKKLAPLSVSCAKRGHKSSWPNRNATSCGRCMPCIYRRAALHAINLDNEIYGADICKGEVDIDAHDQEAPNDLRACFSFLKSNPPLNKIAMTILAGGSLNPAHLSNYASIIQRAMNEIRKLLRDKANPKIQQQAGI